MDIGYSSHIIRDKQRFENIKEYEGGFVRFRNNKNTKIVGKGTINLKYGKVKTKDVIFVIILKHNLLNLS